MDLRYDSIAALIEAAKQSGRKLSELVLEQQAVQMEQSADELYEIMRKSYAVMAASVEEGKAPGVRSASGLSGGDAYRMARAEREGNVLCGGVFSGALTRALAVSEWNAAMGRIVAAQLALAGIRSPIPADEAILAMKRVGDAMPAALKETAEGGLAATPAGKRLYEQVFGKNEEGDASPACPQGCSACRM